MKPRIFVASSVESLDLANAVQENLEHDAEVTVWNQGIFNLSRYAMESLVDALNSTDFGIFVLAADDVVKMRGDEQQVARDNVIFELGLFIGKLGKERNFLIIPRADGSDFRLPSDLLGITPAEFPADRTDGNAVAALGPACARIRRAIRSMGTLPNPDSIKAEKDATRDAGGLVSDEDDCINILESWMGARRSVENQRAIKFSDVDKELKLQPGSAMKYLEIAARRWDYIVNRRGTQTITFK
ncbi:TIR domain-containing protein [Hyphococcus sp.]|uniref:TIR domain-containing protein n=1 Tax=Hyphococcus sp. TaxID=2038636 RepID=UPI0035C745E3